MTSSRPETAVRPERSADEAKSSPLSPVQIAAGALAAVSSAVVASLFGVAGTLIGAALASVISTVSAALYSSSLHKTNQGLRRVRTQFTEQRPVTDDAATRAMPATGPATRALPAHLDPRRAPAKRRRPRWSRVTLSAVAVFLVAMGIVTGIELIGQQPVSALVGGSQESGETTIGSLGNAAAHRDQPRSTPSAPATSAPATPSADSSPSAEPSATQTEESRPATPSATAPTTDSAPATATSRSPESTQSSSSSSASTPGPAGAASPTP